MGVVQPADFSHPAPCTLVFILAGDAACPCLTTPAVSVGDRLLAREQPPQIKPK